MALVQSVQTNMNEHCVYNTTEVGAYIRMVWCIGAGKGKAIAGFTLMCVCELKLLIVLCMPI